ncbi:MAG: Gfo/Idh/MocA family oxidoreductase [Elusimicrobia bacterium]|nr:Gfo/Idh/MocA family oxidoreductase [Elusimicrobiota bacterium]
MTYRAAVIGCGRIGCGFDDDPERGYVSTHAGAYRRTPGVELVALVDVDRDKRERYGKKFNVAALYPNDETLFDREKLDIVSICTWNDTHRAMVERAARAGVKAIFCEKPLSNSLADADAILRICREKNILLMVDHQRRFDRFHREAAAFVRGGGLGRLQQVTAYYTAGVANTGTHLFDFLRFCLGEVDWVQGIESRIAAPNASDPNIDGWLSFKNGPLVAIQALDVRAYTIFEFNFLGESGRFRITSHGFDSSFEASTGSKRFPGLRDLSPAPSPVDAGGGREFMLQAMAHLVECLDKGQAPVSGGEDGRRAMEIICALRESAASDGRRIHLPLKDSPILIPSR